VADCVWTPGQADQPIPPQNVEVVSPFVVGVLDIRWDNPAILARNAIYNVVGVNIYRSDVSDRGPFFRINEFPVGGTFFRDRTDNIQVRESVRWDHDWVFKADAPNDRRWVFRTKHPISKKHDTAPFQKQTMADTPDDVIVIIDGEVVIVDDVFGMSGEVTLINQSTFNVATEKAEPPKLPTPTSVVEVIYYANRNHIRSGLDANIWYRLTTVVLDSTTPSGYTETSLDWCKPQSLMEVERLDYIWRESIRRNQWILQQGGERVKIFIRKQAGVPCTCKMDPRTREYNKQPSLRCLTCFPPGTLVRTELGYRPIETVQAGERVLSADGEFHPVIRTFEKPFTGDLVSLLPSVSTQPILATPEHPFLVMRGAHRRQVGCGPKCNKYIEAGDGLRRSSGGVRLLPSGRWWARVQVNGSRGVGRKALGTFDTEEQAKQAIRDYLSAKAEPGHVLKWDDADTVSKGDWLTAKWSSDVVDLTEISVPQQYLKNTSLGSARLGSDSFPVDEDFLWMVGMYLAEGCKGTRSITFSLHRDEVTFQDRLVSLFSRWGFNPVLRPHADPEVQSARVDVGSTTLALWFPEWLGDGCQNKRVPEELMTLPPEKLRALLQGLHDGDGSKRDREITQTSEVLALQIAEMLHRVGEQPLIRQQKANILTPSGNKRRLAFCVSWAEETLARANRKGRWEFQSQVLTKVRKVQQVPYSGPVYNLEVEGDHTYVVQGVAVHNCFGTGYVGGYEGPYDVIIAPDDAERRIAQTPQGRRKEHTYEVFMGPSPVVTQRDFVTKQTNERYSIGPSRRPSNRGNLLQQHFNISYFDEGDIRYQVPIDGTDKLAWPQTRYGFRHAPDMPVDGELALPPSTRPDKPAYPTGPWTGPGTYGQLPMQTEKAETPDDKEQRGRTPVWENQNY